MSIFFSYSDEFLEYILDILSSHLSLAVQNEGCTRDVLGKEQKIILDLLLKLMDEKTKSDNNISVKVETALQNGAQFLLPAAEDRIEMLLALLPKSSEDLEKTSLGQVSEQWLLYLLAVLINL